MAVQQSSISSLERKINSFHHDGHNGLGAPEATIFSVADRGPVLSTPAAAITGAGVAAALVGAFEAGRSYQGGLYIGVIGLGAGLAYTCMACRKGKNKNEDGEKGDFYLD